MKEKAKTFKEIYGHATISCADDAPKEFVPKFPVIHDSTIFGLELEMENADSLATSLSKEDGPISDTWSRKEDGSLRNHGWEFVSAPVRARDVEYYLTSLMALCSEKEQLRPTFGFRTSIHVHLNMRMFTPRKLKVLLLTYLAAERLIFRWVKGRRYDNINCVPLVTTGYPINFFPDLFSGKDGWEKTELSRWDKYSALNLLPIHNFGTIEFRHMAGTGDISRIMQWLNIILSLKTFAYFTPIQEALDQLQSLNSSSEYGAFIQRVFGEHLPYNPETIQYDMEEGVMMVKAALSAPFTLMKQVRQLHYIPVDPFEEQRISASNSWKMAEVEQAIAHLQHAQINPAGLGILMDEVAKVPAPKPKKGKPLKIEQVGVGKKELEAAHLNGLHAFLNHQV